MKSNSRKSVTRSAVPSSHILTSALTNFSLVSGKNSETVGRGSEADGRATGPAETKRDSEAAERA